MPMPRPTPIYRLMHIDNLSVCLERGGLHAPNHTPDDGRVYRTIHDIEIQQVRKVRSIRCGSGGSVHDYVAFYFGPRSPMLLKLKTGQVEGYAEGQESLIYLVSTVEAIEQSQLDFVFSDGHGVAAFTQWFDNVTNLDKIDWDMVYADYWADTIVDMDRQRRKQAEFLVYRFCPWKVITRIGVLNGAIKGHVENILAKYELPTSVEVCRGWYY
jgi:hypothetical protein